jgi:pilus assembly protein CpaE
MEQSIVYAPASLQEDVAKRLAGMPVSVKASTNGGLLPPPPGKTGKVIVVVSPKGGSGKTAVATNLAASLAMQFPGRVAALDLDVQFGDMCTSMGLHPDHNLVEVAQSSQVDATTIKLFLTPFDAGLYVLCGARTPAEADVVTHQHVSKVVPFLAADFDYVVVDTPAGLDDRTLAALECATDILMVSSLDVTSIRSLRKAVEAMDKLGVTQNRYFVLNRSDAKVGISPADAAEAVGWPIKAMIPSTREIPLSMNVGTPVVKLEPRSAVAKQMVLLTQLFTPPADTDTPRRRLFRRSGR